MARKTFGTVSPTFPVNSTEQVWIAANGLSELCFATLHGEGGVTGFLRRHYPYKPLQWEEATTPVWDAALLVREQAHPCSRLIGTEWRVWRHR